MTSTAGADRDLVTAAASSSSAPAIGPADAEAAAADQVRLPETASVTLDLVRAVAAQAVVVGHAAVFFSVLSILRPPNIPYIQNVGVVVFFLLSGYLISYTVFRKSHDPGYRFRVFAIERFARIFSGFIPGLVFILAIDLLTVAVSPVAYRYAGQLRADVFVSNLLMLQDSSLGRWISSAIHAPDEISALMVPFGSGRPLWTIAIEWWIYLIFGWVTLVIRRDPRSPRGWIMASVFAVIPLYNLVDGRGHSLTLTWLLGAGAFWLRPPLADDVVNRGVRCRGDHLRRRCRFARAAHRRGVRHGVRGAARGVALLRDRGMPVDGVSMASTGDPRRPVHRRLFDDLVHRPLQRPRRRGGARRHRAPLGVVRPGDRARQRLRNRPRDPVRDAPPGICEMAARAAAT